MTQTRVVRGVKTAVFHDENGVLNVVYRGTCVVKACNDFIRLYTGGWKSSTTKLRMNQTANQFGLGFHVFQHKGEWFVKQGDKVTAFTGDNFAMARAK